MAWIKYYRQTNSSSGCFIALNENAMIKENHKVLVPTHSLVEMSGSSLKQIYSVFTAAVFGQGHIKTRI